MTPADSRGPLREGDAVIFIDRKEREYLKRLDRNKPLTIRGGKISADDVIGLEEGSVVCTSMNDRFLVFRPGLAQLIPNLPRSAQVIYPKDIGPMLLWADIFPGASVIEAGVGPGALTMALLRAVGSEGRVTSYEIREDFARMAQDNVAKFFGAAPNWTLRIDDVALRLAEESGVDRIMLDLPEPWHAVDGAWKALRPGGILLCYLPTVLQVKSLVDALRQHGRFACIETMEALLRFWHIQGQSMRPQHRMVAHTGFITVARRLAAVAQEPS